MATKQFEYLTSLSKEQYHHIGEVIYRLSLLDFQLVEILGLLLDLNKKQRRLAYINSDFKGKLAVLKTVASKWLLNGPLRRQINEVISLAFTLEERRNLYGHTIFGQVVGSTEVRIIHMRTGEQRHLPGSEFWNEALAAEERETYSYANQLAAHIIGVLEQEKGNPKFVKLELRQPDPPSPKTP